MEAINYSTCFSSNIQELFEEKADMLFFKKGQLVYHEGSTPIGAYFVQQGKVKISRLGSLGKQKIVKIVVHPELLTFSDLFSRRKYCTSAEALEDTYLLFVSKDDFWKILENHHEIASYLLCRLAHDINKIEENITDLAYKPVRGRLANAILTLDLDFNGKNETTHSICLTRTDLAGYVGTVKETVNRLLSEFREERIISTSGSRINIHDLNRLSKISQMYD